MSPHPTQFRELALRWAPRFLTRGAGGKVLYAAAAPLDALMQWVWEGVQARMPLEATASALSAIGRDRRIVRGFAESDEAYRLRLSQHLQAWRYAGHARAVMQAVAGYCAGHELVQRIVTNSGVWYRRAADGTLTWEKQLGTWDWDGDPDSWWRFWLILYPPSSLWTEGPTIGDPALWGGAIGSSGYTIGSTATPEQVAAIRGLVQTWMPAHAICERIIVAFDPASFDPSSPEPDGLWHFGSKGDPRVASRLSTARYWRGVAA